MVRTAWFIKSTHDDSRGAHRLSSEMVTRRGSNTSYPLARYLCVTGHPRGPRKRAAHHVIASCIVFMTSLTSSADRLSTSLETAEADLEVDPSNASLEYLLNGMLSCQRNNHVSWRFEITGVAKIVVMRIILFLACSCYNLVAQATPCSVQLLCQLNHPEGKICGLDA